MAPVLAVGIATLDLIQEVDHYPAEDEELRAQALRRRRGGNATNTLEVLARLGHRCRWAGNLADDPDSTLVSEQLHALGIDLSAVRRHPGGQLPLSTIWLNRATGSRTIVHYRNLPEYDHQDFARLDLSDVDWIHFEGRAPDQLGPMLERARRRLPGRISLEVEKPRPGIEALFTLADRLLFSRHYAQARGYQAPRAFLQEVAPGGKTSYLAWGETGAWCRTAAGDIHHQPAPQVQAVDTLGAGDTFNAGVIHGVLRGWDESRILEFAVRLAAEKCARVGFAGLEALADG